MLSYIGAEITANFSPLRTNERLCNIVILLNKSVSYQLQKAAAKPIQMATD